MALITAAVVAVAAAVATTTVATVATAALAVGTLVGTVGLGVSVVGMATGNKTLTKIGGYLGMAGGVMSVAGGLAGGMAGYTKALSSAWDDGVGSLFSSTKSVGTMGLEQEALGRGIVAANNPDAAAHFAKTGVTASADVQKALGEGIMVGTRNPPSTATAPTVLSPDASPSYISKLANTPENLQLARQAQDIKAIANANPVGAIAPSAPSPPGNLALTTLQAAKTPIEQGLNTGGAGSRKSSVREIWDGLPDWGKAQVANSGIQVLGGMAGGWFESASAEERLEMERQAQAWRQQHEDRTQRFTQNNASYAPTVRFGGGMLNRGA